MQASDTSAVPVIGGPQATDGKGRLKIFFGYAAGAGKTFQMLDEAQRRKSRGQDVVIGLVDSHARKATVELVGGFEEMPALEFKEGTTVRRELNAEAIIARKPQLVIVDELQHKNAPGAPRERRWQDVEALLDAGIHVLTTLDVKNLESLNDQVREITGVTVTETVPDRLFQEASEVEMVDATPRALIHRMERGDVYPGEVTDAETLKLYGEGSLSALRELALREVAERVDIDVLEYRRENKIVRPWAARDRVMICVSPTQPSLRLIRRGWRIGQRLRGDVVAVTVEEDAHSAKEQKILEEDFRLAQALEIPIVRLKGDVADELIKYAETNNVTQLVIGHSGRSRVQELIRPAIVNSLIRELRTVDILVVANEKETSHGP